MQIPAPGPGHARMQELAGDWEGEEQMHPSDWDPEGGTAIGRSGARLGLNGFALISNYEQERDGTITFSGHGVMTFDSKADSYTLHWFDSMGFGAEVFEGGFDGDVLTLLHGGPGMHARLTQDLSKAGELRTKMEMSQDGNAWNTLFDGRYERK